ncbi:terminase [Bifidobacterium psychraerophilum]|uniref:terminase n=1 Tax=Bifidobacterium psychraerophilum TaxID=218140 RepID=UPI0039EB03D0
MSHRDSLSSLARHVIQPSGITSTMWPRVDERARACGIEYDRWQDGLGRLMLAKRADGSFAATVGGIVMSICRQTGKTFTVGTMIFILSSLIPNLTVVWTAHRSSTAYQTFLFFKGLAQRKAMRRFIRVVHEPQGRPEVIFVNGSRIMFGARESGFGRGFDAVDVIVFDEAQILSEKTVSDMIPAANASPLNIGLVLYMGTPPKPTDPGEKFTELRRQALAGEDDMVYVEFSADRESKSDDRKAWAKANPSYPSRTPESSMLRMKRQLDDDSFRREALGIWDEVAFISAIDADRWKEAVVERRDGGGVTSYGVDMAPDRSSLAIGACMKHADGTAHIELVRFEDPGIKGVAWAADWIKERWPKTAAVVLDTSSPAMVLLNELQKRHVKVTLTNYSQMGQACGMFEDKLTHGDLKHLPDDEQVPLSLAVQGAVKRDIGRSGAFGWNKKGSDVDISPLVSCTLALYGAFTSKRNPGRKQRMVKLA